MSESVISAHTEHCITSLILAGILESISLENIVVGCVHLQT